MNQNGRTSRDHRSSVTPLRVASNDGDRLKQLIQIFIRSSGVLSADRTPCSKPLAVSHAHALMLLLECSRAGERPTQQQLGQLLGIDKSNVARLCQKMEKTGHLLQECDPSDGRARMLVLTDRGARVASEVERASRARFQRLCAAIPPDDRLGVLSALAVLNRALAASEKRAPRGSQEAVPRSVSRSSPKAISRKEGAAS